MQRSPVHKFIVYTLLVVGAVVFSFPFIWMLSSSVKVDREQYSETFRVMPITPLPQTKSPYVDGRYFDELSVSEGRVDELSPGLRQQMSEAGTVLPDDVERVALEEQIARGLIHRLRNRLPAEVFQGPVDTFLQRSLPLVDQATVTDLADEVYRYLAVGAIRVRGPGIGLYELAADVAPERRWTTTGEAGATLTSIVDQGKPAAKVSYDFATADAFNLSSTFPLPFDAVDLRRLQIDIHPDDTWHNVQIVIEHDGKRYIGQRDMTIANFNWQTHTWQHASEDDYSTKLRTWVVLEEAGTSAVTGPREVKVTLGFVRASQATAWANKVKANYLRTAEQMPIARYLRVSLFLVLAKIVLTVLGSSLAAYAFSRITWPGRDFCFILMLATMMIPPQVTMIPNFLIWVNLGAYNTLSPLWVGSAFGTAFFIFMLRQFMRGIPRDLEDAARIDGCGFLRIYWHVILPLIIPSLAAIAVMTFIGTWNDFMGPLIYIADQRLYPLAFGVYAFSVQVSNNPALSMAASVIMTVPIIAIFFLAQRYFIQGITLTGMKG
jgi:multiple sugar transport system permease protein